MLPPNSMFFAHPFKFIGRYIEAYDLHAGYVSEKTAEMRRQKVEDVKKRAEYRKAHGLEEGEGVFGGWTVKPDEIEDASPVSSEGGSQAIVGARKEGEEIAGPAMAELAEATAGTEDAGSPQAETYVDFEGKQKPVVKKWFGIW